MKVTIIPIVIGAFGIVTKELLKCLEDLEIRGRVETTGTKTLLRMVKILRRITGKLHETKLYSRNLIKGINTGAVSS